MSKPSATHAIVRTSPQGGPFVGVCTLCGEAGLGMGDALKPCPNPAGMTEDDALLDVLAPHHESEPNPEEDPR